MTDSVAMHENKNIQDSVVQKAEQLKTIYFKLSSSYKGMYDYDYFNAFPKSFKMLNDLFGYTDGHPFNIDSDEGLLYEQANRYIEAFFNLDVEKKEHYKRMIEISLDGRWYADGISYFQHEMAEKLKQDLEIFCELLSNYTDQEIQSFWYFYFDGPHPTETIPEELKKVKQINERVYGFMEVGLKEVQEYWKE